MNESEIKRIVQDTLSKIKTDKSVMTLALAEKLANAHREMDGLVVEVVTPPLAFCRPKTVPSSLSRA